MSDAARQTIGFDFGTSTTLIASPDGVVTIGEEETVWMPSVVGYNDVGSIVAGESALDYPEEQIVRSIKRAITAGRPSVRIETPDGIRDVRAHDLIVELLREAANRGKARNHDTSQSGAVRLGCPAMWDGTQRRRLIEAAGEAGISVTLADLVDEPVAAGIAWLAERGPGSGRRDSLWDSRLSDSGLLDGGPTRVLVFDMGGGTLDIAVLDVRGMRHVDVCVLAALGVPEAGDALDEAIAEDLESVLAEASTPIDTLPNPGRARNALPDAARNTKLELTTRTDATVKLSRRQFPGVAISYSRERLNEIFAPQMDRAEWYIGEALKAARRTRPGAAQNTRVPLDELVESVDVVVLSGGMSRVPYVAERLRAIFPDRTRIETACAAPDNAVVLGLAQTTRYGRINMLRPAFDIFLEWEDSRGNQDYRTVYEAYTPLIESWQIAQGRTDLRYVRSGLDLALPRDGRGRLRVKSHSGPRVRASLGGDPLDGFPVRLSEQKFEFSIFPDGRLRMTDGGATYDGQIDDWHTD